MLRQAGQENSQARGSVNGVPEYPHFSIIVAVYNAERFLAETLDSFLAQTYNDFEVIMVDDGSTDGSASIARRYCALDARFQLVQTANQGISPARNLAAEHAAAPWIAVCDADDTWAATKLEEQARFIAQWDGGGDDPLLVLGTGGDLIDAQGGQIRPLQLLTRPWPAALHDEKLMLELHLINSSAVFLRQAFEEVGGYRAAFTPAEDTDLWVRFSERGAVVNLPLPLTHYRMHGHNVSEQQYVRMVLCAHHIRANADRRAAGQPEWDTAAFMAEWSRDRRQYRSTMRDLKQMMYYNRAKTRLSNRQYFPALGAVLLSLVASPARTAQLFGRSKVVGAALGRWRRAGSKARTG